MALPISITDAGTLGNRIGEAAAKIVAKSFDDFTAAYKDRTVAVREQTAAIVQAARLITGADETQVKLEALEAEIATLKGPRDGLAGALDTNQ